MDVRGYAALSPGQRELIDSIIGYPDGGHDYDAGYDDGQRELREELCLGEVCGMLNNVARIVRYSSGEALEILRDIAECLEITCMIGE